MKNIKQLSIIIITFLLFSCSSDGSGGYNYQQLEHIETRVSNDEDLLIEWYYSNGDMLKKILKNNTKISEISYDENERMTKMTSYRDGEIRSQYTFTYDNDGKIISVHDFNINHSPKHQDREVTWNENTMSIPYIVEDRTDHYRFTFNDVGLLINFKVYQGSQNYLLLDANYEYDENDNVIRKFGIYNETEYNAKYYYDNKNNPYYPYLKKYYKNNIVIGKSGIVWGLDSSMQTFGKNNSLKAKNLITDTYSTGYIEYTYSGDTTTQSRIKSTQDNSFVVTHDFFYDE